MFNARTNSSSQNRTIRRALVWNIFPSGFEFVSDFGFRDSDFRASGFTVIELLVVVGIIVLVLALAMPALNIINGTKSIDMAQNQVAVVLAQARNEAIGLQQPRGVFFAYDTNL